MFWICIVLFSLQYVDVTAVPQFFKLQLPAGVIGPEALAFDKRGRGPYMGVADGRILKFQGPTGNFTEFATTSPNRTKEQCDGINDLNLAPVCGRPLGLGFNYHTGDLYIVDVGFGLMVVGKDGGLATQIASGINGTAFGVADALDIDQASGIVYFTDAGTIFKLTSNATAVILSGDTSGRLFKYDPRSKQVTLLLDGLSGPTGVAISADGAYLLITEFIALRIRRFWLKGPMANSADVFTTLEGSPDNIKRNILGDFWVSVNVVNQETSSVLALGQRINALGNVVASLNFTTLYGTNYVYWKNKMETYIQSIDYSLWRLVEQGPYIPMKEVVDKVGNKKKVKIPKTKDEFDDDDIAMITKNSRAKNILYCVLNETEYSRVSQYASSYEKD